MQASRARALSVKHCLIFSCVLRGGGSVGIGLQHIMYYVCTGSD